MSVNRAIILLLLCIGGSLARPALPAAAQKPPEVSPEIHALLKKGDEAVARLQREEAVQLFTQALRQAQAKKDTAGEAVSRERLGVALENVGRYDESLVVLEDALKKQQAQGDAVAEADLTLALGATYFGMGQMEKALGRFRQALTLSRKANSRRTEAHVLLRIGDLYDKSGQPLPALERYQDALKICREDKNLRGEAVANTLLAVVYKNLGQYDEALQRYQQAYDLSRKNGDLLGLLVLATNIGEVYAKNTQFPQALDWYQRAIRISTANFGGNGGAAAYGGMGTIYIAQNKLPEARKALETSLNGFRAMADRRSEGSILSQMGFVAIQQGDRQKARAYYEQALPIHRDMENHSYAALTQASIGFLDEQEGRLAAAEKRYNTAVETLEALRANLGALQEAKEDLLQKQTSIYDLLTRLEIRQGKAAQAFAVAQKAKARLLIDLMREGKVEITRDMTSDDRRRAQRLETQIKQMNEEWIAALNTVGAARRSEQPDPAALKTVQTIQTRREHIEREWRLFMEGLFTRHPQLARKRMARTVSLEEVGAFLPDDTALLEYRLLKADMGTRYLDQLVLFVVTAHRGKATLRVFTLPIAGEALQKESTAFRTACAARPGSRSEQQFRAQARQLYTRLLAPAEATLANVSRLLICPDGPLWDVPFQALLAPAEAKNGKPATGNVFLWEKYEIACAYSATAAKAAFDARRRLPAPQAGKTLLALANPDFGSEAAVSTLASRGPDLPVRGKGLSPLPNTQTEAEAIRTVFPDAVVRVRKDAQETTFKQMGGGFRYLHLASHGFVSDTAPLLSFIALAQPPANSEEDGFLTARELFDMNLTAEMVTLSACNTARGKTQRGEGVIGLTWALFVAGVPTQIVSQWSVDDASTAALMQAFYRHLKQGQPKAKALRSAALTLLRDGKHAHPFYWAPFVLMGDWR